MADTTALVMSENYQLKMKIAALERQLADKTSQMLTNDQTLSRIDI